MIQGRLYHRRKVIHTRTRGEYLVAHECKVRQSNGDWSPGVSYSPINNLSEAYVRLEADFRKSFEDPE